MKVYVIITGLGPQAVFEDYEEAFRFARDKGWITGSTWGELEDAAVREINYYPKIKEE